MRSSQQFDAAQTVYQRALKIYPDDARAKAGLAAIAVDKDERAIVARAKADVAAGKVDRAEAALRSLLKDTKSLSPWGMHTLGVDCQSLNWTATNRRYTRY